MPASLETLDQIRDTLISRGIGNSGLTTQAIQRANLPDLSSALATARSIQANEEQVRQQKFQQKQLKNLADIQKNLSSQQQAASGITPLYNQPASLGVAGRIGVAERNPLTGAFTLRDIIEGTTEFSKLLEGSPIVRESLPQITGTNIGFAASALNPILNPEIAKRLRGI